MHKPKITYKMSDRGATVRIDFPDGRAFGLCATPCVSQQHIVNAVNRMLSGRLPTPGVYETCQYSLNSGYNIYALPFNIDATSTAA